MPKKRRQNDEGRKRLAKRIRELRHEKGLTQFGTVVELDLDLARSTISHYESAGKTPSVETLLSLAEVFGVSPAAFFLDPVGPVRERVALAVLACSASELKRLVNVLGLQRD